MYDFPKLHYYQTLSLQALEEKKQLKSSFIRKSLEREGKKVRIFLAVHSQVHTHISCCGML